MWSLALCLPAGQGPSQRKSRTSQALFPKWGAFKTQGAILTSCGNWPLTVVLSFWTLVKEAFFYEAVREGL